MRWCIPGKTFILGEYIALLKQSALLLTTYPCFEVQLVNNAITTVHPNSPAGIYLQDKGIALKTVQWTDPYQGIGGLGASSAQFLAAYYVYHYLNNKVLDKEQLLDNYFEYNNLANNKTASGYDILAQMHSNCVYINREKSLIKCYPWPFDTIDFLLIHTGNKLVTHQHLKNLTLPNNINHLITITEQAHQAFENADGEQLIVAINNYYLQLLQCNLVSSATIEIIKQLTQKIDCLAAKGCGALGADVVLLIFEKNKLLNQQIKLKQQGYQILASSKNLYG